LATAQLSSLSFPSQAPDGTPQSAEVMSRCSTRQGIHVLASGMAPGFTALWLLCILNDRLPVEVNL
jgi:hypothetical protein